MSEKLDLNEFKMTLFDKGNPEEFLLFMKNLKMTIKALVNLTTRTNIMNPLTILHGEAIYQFNTLCDQVGSTNMTHLNSIILDLGMYFPPVI